jgi:hypothetical protein
VGGGVLKKHFPLRENLNCRKTAAVHTPEALPGIIEALQADGYTIVPVSQILLQGDTYQDNTGRQ